MIAAGVIWTVFSRLQDQWKTNTSGGSSSVVPVEVGQIHKGSIELRRTFSGSLEAGAEFVIAPKISGRVEKIYVDLGDVVERGQVVAELDNDEYLQAVALAEADLMVT
jgi:multidrug efflux pump subunit AcrA (membrane-fusion protein)